MKFEFSLDPVLKVKKHQEKLQKQKLAGEMMKKKEVDDLQAEVKEKLRGYLVKAEGNNVQNVHSIKAHFMHMEHVNDEMNDLDKKQSKFEKAVNTEREKLEVMHKERHILEKVKEFELKFFSKQKARAEQNFMDELASQSFNR